MVFFVCSSWFFFDKNWAVARCFHSDFSALCAKLFAFDPASVVMYHIVQFWYDLLLKSADWHGYDGVVCFCNGDKLCPADYAVWFVVYC